MLAPGKADSLTFSLNYLLASFLLAVLNSYKEAGKKKFVGNDKPVSPCPAPFPMLPFMRQINFVRKWVIISVPEQASAYSWSIHF